MLMECIRKMVKLCWNCQKATEDWMLVKELSYLVCVSCSHKGCRPITHEWP